MIVHVTILSCLKFTKIPLNRDCGRVKQNKTDPTGEDSLIQLQFLLQETIFLVCVIINASFLNVLAFQLCFSSHICQLGCTLQL